MLPNSIVKNIRYGLGTNSSSSHSIIHHPAPLPSDQSTGDFGWDFFTLASKEAKQEYMISQFLGSMPYWVRDSMSYFFDKMGYQDLINKISDMYVDHESQMVFPSVCTRPNEDKVINLKFFDEYLEFIVNENFVILGGNDNTEEGHRLENAGDNRETYFQKFKEGDSAYKNGNYWVILNPDRKLRIQFQDEHPEAVQPELIDLKITDYCNIGCNFCYMDSTTSGQHADIDELTKIVGTMAPFGTKIEFALGGGEPTTHPKFTDILRFIHGNGNIVNFTTKSKNWFSNPDIVNTVYEAVSGIAYSVGSIDEAREFIELHQKAFIENRLRVSDPKYVKIYLHLIPEILGNEKFREIIDWVDNYNREYRLRKKPVYVTILGFKEIGRAQPEQRQLIPEILDIILLTTSTHIGVDTKFASDYKELLDIAKIDRKLYTTEEGEYSMYIDGITGLGYKSSYNLEKSVPVITKGAPRYSRKNPREIFEEIKTF